MNQHRSSSELKALAKGSLLGKYGTAISALLTIKLITLAVAFITSNAVNRGSTYGILIYYAISLIIELIAAVFTVGQISFYLNIACKRSYKVSDVFSGFQTHPDKAIIIKFLFLVILLVCLLPFIAILIFYYITKNSILLMFLSILGVLGVIINIYFMLHFSQSFYLLLDFPDKSCAELMKLSKEIMKGNKGRLFYLYIGFIPFLLLGLFSCGIGFLFIIPYMNMTMTHFYLDLIHCREQKNRI